MGEVYIENSAVINNEDYSKAKIKIEGNTFQEKRSGKNKLPYNYSDGMNKEVNGITFSVNDDGSVSATGTATVTLYLI